MRAGRNFFAKEKLQVVMDPHSDSSSLARKHAGSSNLNAEALDHDTMRAFHLLRAVCNGTVDADNQNVKFRA